jgi:molybdopterin molybdotransferase
MISVEEHRDRILAAVRRLAPRRVALEEALGCVLAEDVTAALSLPGFTNSAMDGYAVRSADVAGAKESSPLDLPVAGDIPAGSTARLSLARGQALRIMTGAPLPEGADAVVPVEATDGGMITVSIRLAAEPGRHLRHAAEDVRTGEVVLEAGTLVGPGQLALAAAAGRSQSVVVPRPRVTVLSTGDELVSLGTEPGYGQIVDSNSPMLVAALRVIGALPRQVSAVADDAESFRATLQAAVADSDAVVTTGGVSMGAYDTVKEVLSQVGAMRFDKVAMRPGMPQGFGVLTDGVLADGVPADRVPADAVSSHAEPVGREVPVFTLPGNPVSALVSFHVFVHPALRAMAGLPAGHVGGFRAVAAHDWASMPGRAEYARVVVAEGKARLAGGQGSHMLGALAAANALAVVPADLAVVPAGLELECLPLLGTEI